MAVATASKLKNEASPLILKELVGKAEAAEERWLQETGVDVRYVDNGAPGKVARRLKADALDEFMDYYPETSEETLNEDVKEYINQNYDSDFMYQQIERTQNEDEILDLQTDDLRLFLTNMEKYSEVSDQYWTRCARQVRNISEMQKYLSEDGAEEFVEKYAPDWQESLE